ncbi:relaxase/mobilization nuclease domain-containing protein [Acidithiobacillus thiooxidans]|uniref:TraI/MobA(P) family conjugative relaxase n=1 Tax=Acidithiobacillus thiooxidans TaxID=930 RepID=UPI001C073221|nr:TraI/MobA(P) family conjugative relaxase [Acidithiobacillus thiooxidans]MBU2750313.1 relaxase/mobilization nuclease domain-containing protein [Acidithiobacillus thiooxidans]
MIGKVGKSRTAAKSGSKSQFVDVVNYITREADGKGREVPGTEMGVMNMTGSLDEPDAIIAQMDGIADKAHRKAKFKGDPVYHLVLSWRSEDSPKPDQITNCIRHTLKALGMNECQAVWAIHRDTDDDHVHVAVNRVHPEKGVVMGPPRRDYLIIDKAMRELEIKHGFARDNGPFITLDGKGGPQIVRMSRKERLEKGLLNSGDEHGQAMTQAAKAAERSQGAPSFQEWAQDTPARALRNVLSSPRATWQDVHTALAVHGMVIQPRGSGMVVSTTLESGRVLACPVSKLDRGLTKMKLEQHLGAFTPAPSLLPSSATTYEKFLHARQTGMQSDGPAPYDDKKGQRIKRRAERQVEREGLHTRYKADLQQIKDTRSDARQSLMARQKSERDAFQASTKAHKQAFMAKEAAKGTSAAMGKSLWAYEAARAKEALQKKHLKERHALPRTMVWRDWLEQQAAMGDEAALASLRGIRYREGRKAHQEKNGIEGEELEGLKPILSELHHEIDHRRQLIHYRNGQGAKLFTDTGPRIEMHDRAESSVEAALRIAVQKYGAVDITGSATFREQAARQAARLGIQVRDADLQKVWQEERIAQPRLQKELVLQQDLPQFELKKTRHQHVLESPQKKAKEIIHRTPQVRRDGLGH